MKRILLIVFVLAATVSIEAGSFTIGPRLSNYSTKVDLGLGSIDTGRENSFGVVATYRGGPLVFDFQADHDPENGITLLEFFPVNFSNYERDRIEATAGWDAAPALYLQAGVRFENFTFGGFSSTSVFGETQIEHSALLAGVHVHTPENRPFGAYGLLRGYIGEIQADNDAFNVRNEADAYATRFEGGLILPIGASAWQVVPGVEFEHIRANDVGFDFNTNRFFVNVTYTFGR